MSETNITNKIAKIKALADRASGGEKAAAEAMLEKLIDKYNIDITLLEEDVEVEYHTWHWRNRWQHKLLLQIIWRTVGSDTNIYRQKYQRQVTGCYCTKAEALEIELEFEFHCRMFEQELDDFVLAYINANDLYVYVDKEELPELTEEQKRQKRKAAWMSQGMEKHTRNLMIEDGSQNDNES